MKAAVLVKAHDLQLLDVPMPVLTDEHSVMMKVKAVGICGSDVHAYHGKLATVRYPRTIGHEVVGEIVSVGNKVRNVTAGDHAVIDPVVSCHQCSACRMGRNNVCVDVKCIGVAAEGGCAEYVVMPDSNFYRIPADIPWRDAALMEPFTIGAQVTARGGVAAGDTVLIMGAGTIGQVILQAAKVHGAKVLISDVIQSRLTLAEQMKADRTVNPNEEDLMSAVAEFTHGEGVSVAIDAVGLPQLFETAVELTAPAGRVVVIGFNDKPAQVPELPVTRKELDIRGSRMNWGKFPTVIEWFAGKKVQPAPLVSHEFSFADIQKAFDLLTNHPEKTCKVIVTL